MILLIWKRKWLRPSSLSKVKAWRLWNGSAEFQALKRKQPWIFSTSKEHVARENLCNKAVTFLQVLHFVSDHLVSHTVGHSYLLMELLLSHFYPFPSVQLCARRKNIQSWTLGQMFNVITQYEITYNSVTHVYPITSYHSIPTIYYKVFDL